MCSSGLVVEKVCGLSEPVSSSVRLLRAVTRLPMDLIRDSTRHHWGAVDMVQRATLSKFQLHSTMLPTLGTVFYIRLVLL